MWWTKVEAQIVDLVCQNDQKPQRYFGGETKSKGERVITREQGQHQGDKDKDVTFPCLHLI
jgi:hypothetical protein